MEDEWFIYTGEESPSELDNVRRVRVAAHVTAIAEATFCQCEGLREVDLGNATTIGEYAFQNCINLTDIDLRNVTEIESGAFHCCKSLRKVNLSKASTIGDWAFLHCRELKELDLTNVTANGVNEHRLRTIGELAFAQCDALVSVNLSEGTQTIGNRAFKDCTKLTTVELCEGIQSIGQWAFFNCNELKHISIPSSVEEIGNDAFTHCTSMATVELCEGIQTIGDGGFHNCFELERITMHLPAFVISSHVGSRDILQCQLLQCQLARDEVPFPDDIRMVASRRVKYIGPECLAEVETKINAILQRHEATDEKDTFDRIRALFAFYEWLDATTLPIWKAKIDESMQNTREGSEESRGQKRARVDPSLQRAQCRSASGAHIILPLVVSYLRS